MEKATPFPTQMAVRRKTKAIISQNLTGSFRRSTSTFVGRRVMSRIMMPCRKPLSRYHAPTPANTHAAPAAPKSRRIPDQIIASEIIAQHAEDPPYRRDAVVLVDLRAHRPDVRARPQGAREQRQRRGRRADGAIVVVDLVGAASGPEVLPQ